VARRKSSRKTSGNGNLPGNASARKNEPRSKPPRVSSLKVAKTADGTWELVHPRCALARRDDLDEVQQMLAAGENEIAQDELRWLLSDCHDFVDAHKLLGDLALAANDVRLARGHYGYAYQLCLAALPGAGQTPSLPFRHAANQAFFEAGRGAALCLMKMGQRRMAREVIDRLLQLDSSDPLQLRAGLNVAGPCRDP
jgi:tetratricopeptide (TPR) repeat protein